MQISAREAALLAIDRCVRDGAWSGQSIDTAIKKANLDKRDAALASRLVLGVLQNLSFCDYYIALYYSKPLEKLETKLLNILRLGAYQLLFLDKIPARAAVNEAVSICKKTGYSRASGLVNAVLRKIADNKYNLPDIPGSGSAEYLSVKYSHPIWIAEKIIAEYGYDFAESFLRSNNDIPGLYIQINTLKISAIEYKGILKKERIEFEALDYLPDCILLKGGNVTQLPGYEEGLFYVQDKAARAALAIAGAAPDMNVLDCCSAPGGKSFAAAISMENKGSILSCDIHQKKLRLISEGANRLGISIISTCARDARAAGASNISQYDLVIADVPCSGLGVIRKKPEIRNKAFEEISDLPKIQSQIIDSAALCVKTGGILIYSTCTVLKEENENIVQAFLERNPDFEYVDFELGNIKSNSGMYTFWPHLDGSDGFFAAKLRRIK